MLVAVESLLENVELCGHGLFGRVFWHLSTRFRFSSAMNPRVAARHITLSAVETRKLTACKISALQYLDIPDILAKTSANA